MFRMTTLDDTDRKKKEKLRSGAHMSRFMTGINLLITLVIVGKGFLQGKAAVIRVYNIRSIHFIDRAKGNDKRASNNRSLIRCSIKQLYCNLCRQLAVWRFYGADIFSSPRSRGIHLPPHRHVAATAVAFHTTPLLLEHSSFD